MTRCFTSRLTLWTGNQISGEKAVKRKKTTLPEAPTCIAEYLRAFRTLSTSWLKNTDPMPYQDTEAKPACAEHACLLGSTNPSPTSVHMKIPNGSPQNNAGAGTHVTRKEHLSTKDFFSCCLHPRSCGNVATCKSGNKHRTADPSSCHFPKDEQHKGTYRKSKPKRSSFSALTQ